MDSHEHRQCSDPGMGQKPDLLNDGLHRGSMSLFLSFEFSLENWWIVPTFFKQKICFTLFARKGLIQFALDAIYKASF